MNDDTESTGADLIGGHFDAAHRLTPDDGFSDHVLARLDRRRVARKLILATSALLGLCVFATQLPGIDLVTQVYAVAGSLRSFTFGSLSGSLQALVLTGIVVWVTAGTLWALVQAISTGRPENWD